MNKAEILIIDDEVQMRKLLEITLQSNNYAVNQAENAKNGLITAENHPPDLILLDLGLPDEDGQAVLQKLRECKRRYSDGCIPCIALILSGLFYVSTLVALRRSNKK